MKLINDPREIFDKRYYCARVCKCPSSEEQCIFLRVFFSEMKTVIANCRLEYRDEYQ